MAEEIEVKAVVWDILVVSNIGVENISEKVSVIHSVNVENHERLVNTNRSEIEGVEDDILSNNSIQNVFLRNNSVVRVKEDEVLKDCREN